MRAVTIIQTGSNSGPGGYAVQCQEVRIGMGYTDPSREAAVLALLLDAVTARLGEQAVVGSYQRMTQEATEQPQLITDDRRKKIAPKPKPKSKRSFSAQWKQEEWGAGVQKGLD